MTVLAYIFIIAVVVFVGLFAHAFKHQRDERNFGWIAIAVLVMLGSGFLMALGVVGALPEVSWE